MVWSSITKRFPNSHRALVWMPSFLFCSNNRLLSKLSISVDKTRKQDEDGQGINWVGMRTESLKLWIG